jgi:hypothetical protein
MRRILWLLLAVSIETSAAPSCGFKGLDVLLTSIGIIGIGANTAVRDSALLGQLIAKAGGYAPDITAKYERSMRVYASEAVASSYRLGKAQFGILIGDQSPSV